MAMGGEDMMEITPGPGMQNSDIIQAMGAVDFGDATPMMEAGTPMDGMPFEAPPTPTPVQPAQDFRVHEVHFNGHNLSHYVLPPQYTDVKQIASGTYGMVVAAKDVSRINPETGQPIDVAIKKFRHPWNSDVEAHRAYREIRLLRYLQESWPASCAAAGMDVQSMQHENVIALIDCFIAQSPHGDEDMYLVMEHGGSDLQKVSGIQQVSLDHVKFFGYQMLRAFIYLHSAGIIHRDVKPSNIACSGKCDIKILDFGLARIENDQNSRMTGYVATRYYRAPEVIMRWGKYANSLDMWSFGCVLAELLTQSGDSRVLFKGQTFLDQLIEIAKVLGKPNPEYIAQIDGNAQTWVNSALNGMQRQRLAELPRFFGPNGEAPDPHAMDLLERLLQYEPEQRLTAEQAIRHPFFEEYHDPADEPRAAHPFDDSFEKWQLDKEGWKQKVIEEITAFRLNPPLF